jgi:hypothetical protein
VLDLALGEQRRRSLGEPGRTSRLALWVAVGALAVTAAVGITQIALDVFRDAPKVTFVQIK